MVYCKEQKIKIVEWRFESKCYKTACLCYAREFNVRYVEAPQQKFTRYTVQKFITKEQSLIAERGKLVCQSLQDFLQMWIESVLLYSRVQKSLSGAGAKSLGYQ